MCGREVRWVGRLRGRETVEANYVKDNEIRHSGIRGQERAQCVPSSPWSLATLGSLLLTVQALGTWHGLIESKQGQVGNDKVRKGRDRPQTLHGRPAGDGKEGNDKIKPQAHK